MAQLGLLGILARSAAIALCMGSALVGTAPPLLADAMIVEAAQPARSINAPEIYFLRGFADVFSDGLNQMGTQLNARGITTHVYNHTMWQSVARRIIQDREKNGASRIVLVGHSLGANAVVEIAETLARRGIAVDQLVTLAATDPDPLPANVRRATNYYFETNGWGRRLVPGQGFRGVLVNRDYSSSADIGHFNIDKQRSVQAEILSLVTAAVR